MNNSANPFDLSGRVALITGASRGLGKQIAIALARAGADVLIGGRDEKQLNACVDQIEQDTGRRALGITSDLSDPSTADRMVEAACMLLGGFAHSGEQRRHQCSRLDNDRDSRRFRSCDDHQRPSPMVDVPCCGPGFT